MMSTTVPKARWQKVLKFRWLELGASVDVGR
jgi:hypothetical protein